jgi:Undecaprenyl-phosphate glucose phosphotransferase
MSERVASMIASREATPKDYAERLADPSEPSVTRDMDGGAINTRTLPAFVAAIEFVLVALAAFGASSLYHRLMFGQLPFAAFYFGAAFVLSALFVVPCVFARDYSVKQLLERQEQLRSVLLRWSFAYSVFVFGLFMVHATDFYSRGSIVAQYIAGLATALLVRLVANWLVAKGLQSKRIRGRSVVVIGEADRVRNTVSHLRYRGKGAEIAGVIVIAPGRSIAQQLSDVVQKVRELSQRLPIDDIVLDVQWSDIRRVDTLMEGLAIVPAAIHLSPDPTWSWARNPVWAHVGPLSTIRLASAPLTLRDRVVKRAFDITVATALLILALPLFAAIAVVIKAERRGPVFFRQRRNGFNQHEFRVFKFRTMTTLDDGPSIRQATRNDARITRVGSLLRRTNLDETPQLVNVILGHMSLVGPRPHAVAHNTEYEERIRIYAQRHKVKPGITGLAQINGHRGETDSLDKMLARVEHDLLYIDQWSLFLDVKIMLKTLFSRRSYSNAY